jgi:hypothetical protein
MSVLLFNKNKTRCRQLHAGSGFSKWIMRVLLLSHPVPFADYRHHQQSGAAPIPVVVSEVCGSLKNARNHNSHPARAALIYDRGVACQSNPSSYASSRRDLMFVDRNLYRFAPLRRSGMLHSAYRWEHFAPWSSGGQRGSPIYKHLAPPELMHLG